MRGTRPRITHGTAIGGRTRGAQWFGTGGSWNLGEPTQGQDGNLTTRNGRRGCFTLSLLAVEGIWAQQPT
jgi:hypothetical protein